MTSPHIKPKQGSDDPISPSSPNMYLGNGVQQQQQQAPTSPSKLLGQTPKSEAIPLTKNTSLRRSASSRFHEKSKVELQQIPGFHDVPPEERQSLLIKKLKQCCYVFDFSDTESDKSSKAIKLEALLQCVEFLSTNKEVISEPIYEAVFEMVASNLFRPLPPRINPYGVMYDPEEDEPILEPAWMHIQIVYELLLRFVDSTNFNTHIAKNYVDQKFVLQLLDLFDSEDPRERDYLKTTLHRIYGKFIALRGYIRTAIRDLFCTFVYESSQHNGVSEILEVLGSIINGFAVPLKDEHKQFLTKVLLPLHKPKSYSIYCSQLGYCISQFLEKDPMLALTIFKSILRQWPIGNSQKEVLFLYEIEDLLGSIRDEQQFTEIQQILFKQLARCFQSEHFQVAERSLLLLSNEHIVGLLSSKRSVPLALNYFYKILHDNANNHWNKTIRSLSFNSLKLFMEIDLETFNSISCKVMEEERAKKRQQSIMEDQRARLAHQQQQLQMQQHMQQQMQQQQQLQQQMQQHMQQQQQPQTQPSKASMIRRKSLLPVDPSTIAALSSHRSLEDIVHHSSDSEMNCTDDNNADQQPNNDYNGDHKTSTSKMIF
ncbi:protein phosphatase 2A regulatory subunit [Cavenderia fasciculata]|uniref:Serine/threonine protein phosphatase 2A regulatory subunit n=1 Tax=Cavenderia fasciculata TaxID=261658 RepID=F4PM04_CACFS|nr:protein phosphatase 2A regulatory subunit [Cavenderia fasciculata]EGG22707.1 protein phosphatase 2A regulatory subunit [Cavenderia fasciculata]|eukprot:XP_004360558.1 protein phosphatase 2A regulatory subunit [Cavenderia fasciculata]